MPNSMSSIDPKAIGARIIAIRTAMGMSPADFSRLTGMSSQLISNYETGYRRPDLDKALIIVQKTGATLDYLYLGDASGLPMRLAGKINADEQARKAS